MAQQNKKKWLQLFYNSWGYKPTSIIRKKSVYKGKVELSEALAMACDANQQFLIRIVFPFKTYFPVDKDLSNSITIFPQTVFCDKKSIYEIKEPIFYEESFHSLDKFIMRYGNTSPETEGNMFFRFPFLCYRPKKLIILEGYI
jgi:hypothetical protein